RAGPARAARLPVVRDRSRAAGFFGARAVAARRGRLPARTCAAGRIPGTTARAPARRGAGARTSWRGRILPAAAARAAGVRAAAAGGDPGGAGADPGPALVAVALKGGQGRRLTMAPCSILPPISSST